MKKKMFDKLKGIRNYCMIANSFDAKFAFIGIGHHSLQNLYPIINYLHLSLKIVCLTNTAKANLIKQRWGINTTTEIVDILDDEEIKGVFVSIHPQKHFEIARKVIMAGKNLFIEKPPCNNLHELEQLIDLAQMYHVHVVVGMQRRYSPAVNILKKKLDKNDPISYRLHYTTGLYPEGNPLLDLFIHPLDMICYLFGEAKISYKKRIRTFYGGETLLLALEHATITGLIELSTAYSWNNLQEELCVNTKEGMYRLEKNEMVTFSPFKKPILGLPMEKIRQIPETLVFLQKASCNIPTLINNQLYTQGYYSEIENFALLSCNKKAKSLSSFHALKPTYNLLEELGDYFRQYTY